MKWNQVSVALSFGSCVFQWDVPLVTRLIFLNTATQQLFVIQERYCIRRLLVLFVSRNSCPLSIEGSSACHTHFDTGRPFMMVISRNNDTHPYSRGFNSVLVTTCFIDLGLSRLGFEHPSFRLRVQRSNPLCQRRRLNPLCKSISLN